MTTIQRLLGASLAGLMLSSSVYAGGNYSQGWGLGRAYTTIYGGVSAGGASLGDIEEGDTNMAKIYGGARFNRYLGVEAGYMQLGDIEKMGKDQPGGRLDAEITTDSGAIYGAGVLYVPVVPRIDLIGKAGVARWDQNSEKNILATKEQTATEESGTTGLLGVGAQYQMNDNLFIRGEWEHLQEIGEALEQKTGVNTLSVGVTFSTL